MHTLEQTIETLKIVGIVFLIAIGVGVCYRWLHWLYGKIKGKHKVEQ